MNFKEGSSSSYLVGSKLGTYRFFTGQPFLTQDVAAYLKESEAALVGIDSLNIDNTQGGFRPARTTFLGANIPIIEHVTNLNQLPETGFKLVTAPPKRGFCGFPVRVFAILD